MNAYVRIGKDRYEEYISIINQCLNDVITKKYDCIVIKNKYNSLPWYKKPFYYNEYANATGTINNMVDEEEYFENLLELFSTKADYIYLDFHTYSFLNYYAEERDNN